jgi:hypothetical protein
MKKTKFKAQFQLSTRSMAHAAILEVAGYFVQIVRQPGSRRCVYYADDLPETRELIRKYDQQEALPLPTKLILEARTDIHQRSRRLCAEGL